VGNHLGPGVAMVIGSPELRAEVLRVLHKMTAGVPTVTVHDLAGQPLSPAERRLSVAAGEEDYALLNALLELEAETRERDFAALERLLALAQFEDGDLDDRLLALPPRAFASAASALYELGWVHRRA
jgi:hypothetical protein